MAYANKYKFEFLSTNGKTIDIYIKQDGYTGSVVTRHIAGTPTIRMESSDCVYGSSLEFDAESLTDNEYADLYTSDPYKYQVWAYADNVRVWQGYITPELYACSWVDAPYDVTLTATDGLGELKLHDYPAMGRQTIGTILSSLLAYTGWTWAVRMVSTLRIADDSVPVSAGNLLSQVCVNLDHMAGKSCYDVLQALLRSFHMTLRQYRGRWLLIRETDINSLYDGNSRVADTDGNYYSIVDFGSMQTNPVWPVGALRMEISPAKNGLKAIAENVQGDTLLSGTWTGTNATSGTFPDKDGNTVQAWALSKTENLNDCFVTQTVTAPLMMDGLKLDIPVYLDEPYAMIARIYVSVTGRTSYNRSGTFRLSEAEDAGKVKWVLVANGTGDPAVTKQYTDGNSTYATLSVDIPLKGANVYYDGSTWDRFTDITAITVKIIKNGFGGMEVLLPVEMVAAKQYESVTTGVILNNDARGSYGDIELALPDPSLGWAYLNTLKNRATWLEDGRTIGGEKWASSVLPALKYGEAMAKDYALSIALPRMRLQGRLNVAGDWIPLFMRTGGLAYLAESYALDLLNDEAEVSLISLPAAALQTTSVTVTTTDSEGGTATVSGLTVSPHIFVLEAEDDLTRHYVYIDTAASTAWTVTGKPAWMTLSAASGTGPALIYFTVTDNASSSGRSATLSINGREVYVTQASADSILSVSPTRLNITADAYSGPLDVVARPGETWYLSAGSPSVSINNLMTCQGQGAQTVALKVTANTSTSARSFSVTLIDSTYATVQTVLISQEAGAAHLQDLDVNGPTTVNNSSNTATYTAVYIPSNTPSTEQGVTWSIVSGSAYASINSSTGVLTVLPGANNAAVKILATSTYDTSLYCDYDIRVTYFAEVPVTAIAIMDDDYRYTIDGLDHSYRYTVDFTPSNTTQTGVAWSIEDGEEFVALDELDSQGNLILHFVSTMQTGDQVTIMAESTVSGNNVYDMVTLTKD